MFGIAILKFVFHIFFQIMQYKYITYSFYNDHMIYKDDFLNQHKKNILYSNVKEVEILGKCMLLPINIKQKIEISTKITKLLEDNIDNNKKKVK